MQQLLVRIKMFGGLTVSLGEEVITRFRTRKTAQLLAYLAFYSQRPHPRELLVDLFWPECTAEDGRHSLSVAFSSLRQQLEPAAPGGRPGLFHADRFHLGLNRELVRTDVRRFEECLREAARREAGEDGAGEQEGAGEAAALLEEAADLYAGNLLPDCYEEWVFPEQQRLQELYFESVRRLIRIRERQGAPQQALETAIRAVRIDPLREEIHRETIRLYLALGQPRAALRQFRELEQRLRNELGVAPEKETAALVRSLNPDRPNPSAQGTELRSSSAGPGSSVDLLEPIGGAVPLHSRFYVERPTDAAFHRAVSRGDSIVLVKGPRQVGKTSLLARGLKGARDAGTAVAVAHFQMLDSSHLETADSLFYALSEDLCDQLDLDTEPGDTWDPRRGASPNLHRDLRKAV